MSVRVLLLGSSGYLGSHIASVIAVDPRIALIRHVNSAPLAAVGGPTVRFELASASAEELAEFLRDAHADVIINAVGWTGRDEALLERLNHQLVRRLVAAASAQAAACRFVHLGSAAEYGAGPAGSPVSESADPHPTSTYGKSKLAGTLRVVAAADRGALEGTVLRVFNPIGARMPAGSLAADAAVRISAAARSGTPSVDFGDLSDYRDFVDANDVARAVLAAVVSPREPSRIVNIGSGAATLVRDVVHRISAAVGYAGSIVERKDHSHRSADVPWQCADISLAQRELQWNPLRHLGRSIDDLLASLAR